MTAVKSRFAFCLLWLVLMIGVLPVAHSSAQGCTGDANCHACSNCHYCKHCAKEGGSCGVKERLLATLGQTQPAAMPSPVAAVPASATTTFQPTPASTPNVASIPPTTGNLAPQNASDVQAVVPLSTCITAIASQSDPAKLATLGDRRTNPRLKRIMYYLAQARAGGADAGDVIDRAQQMNGSFGSPRAPLVKASLLRNLKICDGLGMLTPHNLERLRRGAPPVVMRGPYAGQIAEVDHIVPRAHAFEADNELANLELLPARLNRGKGAKVGDRQLALAKKFFDAGLIPESTMVRLQARYVPAGTVKYELQEP